MTPVEILQRARTILAADDGKLWGKGDFITLASDGTEQFCALGALYQAAELPRDTLRSHGFELASGRPIVVHEAEELLEEALSTVPARYDDDTVPDFNDRPSTTLEDILDLFDRAISIAPTGVTL